MKRRQLRGGSGTAWGGFTLLEGLAILVLLGILGVVVFGRVLGSTGEVRSEADQLAMQLGYARGRALADIVSWRVELFSEGWRLGNGRGSFVRLAGETGTEHRLPDGLAIEDEGLGAMVFDEWGRPVDAVGDPLTEDVVWTIGDGEFATVVTVRAGTGLVEIE